MMLKHSNRTALHWAAKRNHVDVTHFLTTNGADKNLESFAKEIPADLSTSPAVLNILGSTKIKASKEDAESHSNNLIPSYLAQPNTGYKVDLQEHSSQYFPVKIAESKGNSQNSCQTTFRKISGRFYL